MGKLLVSWLVLGIAALSDLGAQSVTRLSVATLAGTAGGYGLDADGQGGAARFNAPNAVALDASGNVWVADMANAKIREISPAGLVTTLFITGATLQVPTGIAVDAAGNIYVADLDANTVYKIAPSGAASVLAGGGRGSLDGMGLAAEFAGPESLAVDSQGNVYVADIGNNTLRKITPAGYVSTLAGSPGVQGTADGVGSAARFEDIWGVAVDAAGNIYVADRQADAIRLVTPQGMVSTIAGTPLASGSADGTGSAAHFYYPTGIAVDSAGNLWVSDSLNDTIRRVAPGGVVTTVAGVAGAAGGSDGVGALARFNYPGGVAVGPTGNVYVADTNNATIRVGQATSVQLPVITTQPQNLTVNYGTEATFTVVAGGTPPLSYQWAFNGASIGGATGASLVIPSVPDTGGGSYTVTVTNGGGSVTSGSAVLTVIVPPPTITVQPQSANVQIGDSATLSVTATEADTYQWFLNGTKISGATSATYTIYSATASSAGSYVVLVANTAGGVTSQPATVTVNPTPVVQGDFPPAYVGVAYSFAVTASNNPTLFTASGLPPGLRIQPQTGLITGVPTAAGTYSVILAAGNSYGMGDSLSATFAVGAPPYYFAPVAGYASQEGGADGTAKTASFNQPDGIVVDSSGNLYVADTGNDTIRRIDPNGNVTTVAGWAGQSGSADGAGGAARFNHPTGLAIDSQGNLYVADTDNQSIRKVSANGTVTTLAGGVGQTGSTDANGLNARFAYPMGIAVDGTGDLYVVDSVNDTIRKITPTLDVTTVAGLAGVAGTADGQGANARFDSPVSVVIDASGNICVLDGDYTLPNGGGPQTSLRKVSPQGQVTTAATPAQLEYGTTGYGQLPATALAADSSGDVFVSGLRNFGLASTTGLWEIAPTGAVSQLTIQYSSSAYYTGDYPTAMTMDAFGSLYLTVFNFVAEAILETSPAIATSPSSQAPVAGQPLTLTAGAVAGLGPFTYQWKLNGVNIPGATNAVYAVAYAGTNQGGSYQVVVTGADGLAVASVPANVNVLTNAWLSNLSARADVGPASGDADVLLAGFVTTGSSPKSILIRGAGPALAGDPFDMANALLNPQLTLHDSTGAAIDATTSWDSSLTTIFASLGAFPFAAGSNDTALLHSCPPGLYSSEVSSANGQPGVAVLELYDADQGAPASRLVNLSARANCGTGNSVLIGGFAIGGTTSETVLIRGVGPTLASVPFSMADALGAVILTVFDSAGNVIASNDAWHQDPPVLGPSTVPVGFQDPSAALMTSVGAFYLYADNDAALVLTLPPGTYTAEVSGNQGATGVAMVEIYEVR